MQSNKSKSVWFWSGLAAAASVALLFVVTQSGRSPQMASEATDGHSTSIAQATNDSPVVESVPGSHSARDSLTNQDRIAQKEGTQTPTPRLPNMPAPVLANDSRKKPAQITPQDDTPAQAPAPAVTIVAPTLSQISVVPLPLKLPKPAFLGTPEDIAFNEHIEKPSDKPRPLLMVPAGVTNLSLGQEVRSSDSNPVTGELSLVTDGDKESNDTSFVQLRRGLQWVQIDLGGVCEVYAVVIWHAHNAPQIYRDVVVQISDDPQFTVNVRTVFNNDYDNSSGLGVGTDKEYLENFEGKLIEVKAVRGRYVRAYSRGSSYSALNRYTEIEVYGFRIQ